MLSSNVLYNLPFYMYRALYHNNQLIIQRRIVNDESPRDEHIISKTAPRLS